MGRPSVRFKKLGGESNLISREKADFILKNIENDIQSVSKYYPIRNRDEIKQEIRIKIWQIMKDNFDKNDASDSEIIEFCKKQVYCISILSAKPITRAISKYNKKHENIENIEIPVDYIDNMEHSVDYSKYESILTKKELKILKYLFSIDNNFDNYDFMSRQLGYTGKGASKYFILNIAKKIKEFNENNKK